MIPLIRKNIRLLGIGKPLFLFIGCLLFSLSSRSGTVLSFEQHLLSATTDHYYLTFFLLPLILLSCFALAEDDPSYAIFRFRGYHHYFFRKWTSLCVLPAILVLVQMAAILLSGLGLSRKNTWILPAGSLDTELFDALSQVFSSPLTALAGSTGYLFLGIWLISGFCMWLTHFAGHKWAVRILIGLYVLSVLWIKVPGLQTLPITGLNHLVILHHNLESPTRWIATGVTVVLLLVVMVCTLRFPVRIPQKQGIGNYYRKALLQKRNFAILGAIVLGMTLYKGLSDPYLTSGQEWVYHLFSGHGTGTFQMLPFLEMLIVNTAPLYLLAVFLEHSLRTSSAFLKIRVRSRREILHGLLGVSLEFVAAYAVIWFAAGLLGGMIFGHPLDSILFLLGCTAMKFLDILVQGLVMLLCCLLTKQITLGFLVILAGNLLCVIPGTALLPFGISGTARIDWLHLGLGIPVYSAFLLLAVLLVLLLGLTEALGPKKL